MQVQQMNMKSSDLLFISPLLSYYVRLIYVYISFYTNVTNLLTKIIDMIMQIAQLGCIC